MIPTIRRAIGGAAALLALAACEFDATTVPSGEERLVVHAVLDPTDTAAHYEILVERTLTGRVTVADRPLDPDDPIVSGEGSPVTGAEVRIRAVPPDSSPREWVLAREMVTERSDGKGRGVYRLLNRLYPPQQGPCPTCLPINPGWRYDLEIRTGDRRVVTGYTFVPETPFRQDTLPTVTFDRDGAGYLFAWPHAVYAYRYALQIQSPWGPVQLFTGDSSIALTGHLRNVGTERLPRAFIPGFAQPMVVLGVDQNYFDYYRSSSSPFTGSGIINRLEGAVGVFGSVAAIRRVTLDVVAPVDEPIEGTWRSLDAATRTRLTLYVDPGTGFASGNVRDLVDGNRARRRGVLGARSATGLRLALLAGVVARDTALTFDATLRGDTLLTTGTRTGGVERWIREPTTP